MRASGITTIESRLNEPEKRALPRNNADHFERLTVNQDRFVNRTGGRKKCIGHIVADHADVGAAARFQLVEKAAFFEIKCRCDDVIRHACRGSKTLFTSLSVYLTLR